MRTEKQVKKEIKEKTELIKNQTVWLNDIRLSKRDKKDTIAYVKELKNSIYTLKWVLSDPSTDLPF